jgi:hypothetical protein
MRTYERGEIVRFLRAVDEALKAPEALVLIGGGAVMLMGSPLSTYRTKDLDFWGGVSGARERAGARAGATTGLDLPLDPAGVADGPYGLDDRLVRVLADLRHLAVRVPDRHDLALMKIIRGYEKDLDAVEDLHRADPLDYEVLVRRYDEEMSSVVSEPSRLRMNMLQLIERLFPTKVRDAEGRLRKAHARWREIASPHGPLGARGLGPPCEPDGRRRR